MSDDAGDPNFVPSIYPKTASKKLSSTRTTANVESVARFNCAKRISLVKEIVEVEERGKEVTKRKEEERRAIVNQHVRNAFQHDHGSYCSRSKHPPARDESIASSCSLYLQSSQSGDERVICAEVGKSCGIMNIPTVGVNYHDNIFRMPDG